MGRDIRIQTIDRRTESLPYKQHYNLALCGRSTAILQLMEGGRRNQEEAKGKIQDGRPRTYMTLLGHEYRYNKIRLLSISNLIH